MPHAYLQVRVFAKKSKTKTKVRMKVEKPFLVREKKFTKMGLDDPQSESLWINITLAKSGAQVFHFSLLKNLIEDFTSEIRLILLGQNQGKPSRAALMDRFAYLKTWKNPPNWSFFVNYQTTPYQAVKICGLADFQENSRYPFLLTAKGGEHQSPTHSYPFSVEELSRLCTFLESKERTEWESAWW